MGTINLSPNNAISWENTHVCNVQWNFPKTTSLVTMQITHENKRNKLERRRTKNSSEFLLLFFNFTKYFVRTLIFLKLCLNSLNLQKFFINSITTKNWKGFLASFHSACIFVRSFIGCPTRLLLKRPSRCLISDLFIFRCLIANKWTTNEKLLTIQSCACSSVSRNCTTLNKHYKNSARNWIVNNF